MLRDGIVRVAKKKEYRDQKTKFDTYADYEEKLATIPSHRYLAIRRGEAEGVLRARAPPRDGTSSSIHREPGSREAGIPLGGRNAGSRSRTPSSASSSRPSKPTPRRSSSAAPMPRRSTSSPRTSKSSCWRRRSASKSVLGIDPGQSTGCKCAVLDETGKLRDHATIYLVQGEAALAKARETLRALLPKSAARAVAVGNGTHGRETEAFVREVLSENPT